MKQAFQLFLFFTISTFSQQVAILKYNGGGDWYSNPTAIPNLIEFTNTNCKTNIAKTLQTVTATDEAIFNYPILFMTGHGICLFF